MSDFSIDDSFYAHVTLCDRCPWDWTRYIRVEVSCVVLLSLSSRKTKQNTWTALPLISIQRRNIHIESPKLVTIGSVEQQVMFHSRTGANKLRCWSSDCEMSLILRKNYHRGLENLSFLYACVSFSHRFARVLSMTVLLTIDKTNGIQGRPFRRKISQATSRTILCLIIGASSGRVSSSRQTNIIEMLSQIFAHSQSLYWFCSYFTIVRNMTVESTMLPNEYEPRNFER